MATKPTKLQVQARDKLAQAINLIAEAARLDGRSTIDEGSWKVVAAHVARGSSAYSLAEIVATALERRALAAGVTPSTAEMLTFAETGTPPLDMLLLDDADFLAATAAIEMDLGGL